MNPDLVIVAAALAILGAGVLLGRLYEKAARTFDAILFGLGEAGLPASSVAAGRAAGRAGKYLFDRLALAFTEIAK